MNPTEHQIQQQIMHYLEYKGYYVQRLNAGKYSLGEGTSRRFVKGVKTGTPDIMAFKLDDPGYMTTSIGVNLLFIEVKRPGKKATPLQEMKMKELERYGARCFMASSIEDLEKVL